MEDTRRELLEGVRTRDPEALSAFFEEHVDAIYDFAYRLLGERAPAEDATQEVFLRVHRAAERLDPERDPRPWLAQITRNVCRDVWRSAAYRAGRRSVSVDADEPDGVVLTAPKADPEQATLDRERDEIVQAAILKLPEGEREIVVLHDYRGLRHDEIADVVGVSHAAVRKRYSRALARLAESLRRVLE